MKKFGIKKNDPRRRKEQQKLYNYKAKWISGPNGSGLSSPRNALIAIDRILRAKKSHYDGLKLKYDKDLKRSQK